MCDFLLVINTNLPPILHRFRDIALEMSKIVISGYRYPLRFNPPTEGFPWDDLRKFVIERSQMAKVPITEWRRNIAENFNRLNRVHERYRQTDDRQTKGR